MKTGLNNFAALRVRGPFRAFENRNYAFLWLANCLSDTARWMQMTLVAWLVLELTDSSWNVAVMGFFFMLPTLLLGLAGGLLADEMDRRRLLIMTLVSSFIASLVFSFLLGLGTVKVWQTYLIVFINSATWTIGFPSRRALIYDLFGASGVTNGVALDTVAMNVSRVLGPGLSGFLISLTGVFGGYGVVTFFYIISPIFLYHLDVTYLSGRGNPARSIIKNLIDGFRYIRQTPILLAVVWITVAMNFLLFPYMPMVSVIARDVLHVGPTLMGILQAAQGLGAVTGAISIASAGNISYHGRIFVGGALLSLIGLGIFSMSEWYIFSFPTVVCIGLGVSGFTTIQAALVMLVTKKEMRGRALGVVSLAIGSGPLGSLALGATSNVVGPVHALGINALAGIIAVTGIAVAIPSIIARTTQAK